MRILHSSDWHIGRTFHTSHTLQHLAVTIDALVDHTERHGVDVVVVAGDIFDSAAPSGEAFDFLADALQRLAATGATVVVSSGNHDSPARLRFPARWAASHGIHIAADPRSPVSAIPLHDEHGTVWCYPLPYLEPALVRDLPGAGDVRRQEDAVRWAITQVRDDLDHRAAAGDRTLLLAHCFAAGVPETTGGADIERDLTAGGIDVVPLELFDDFDYVALGHIHTRAVLTERVRYCGAPLHYSFSEIGAPRGVWLVDFDAGGFAGAEWLDLPVPRRLTRLTGTLDELLTDPSYTDAEHEWVTAVLTDESRPADAMAKLRRRFQYAVHLEYQHAPTGARPRRSRAERDALSDEQWLHDFYQHIRGSAPTPDEQRIHAELLDELRREEATT